MNRDFISPYRGVSGVYKITNRVTGESYVGASCNVGARRVQHLNCNTLPIQKDIQELGPENFTFEIIEEAVRADLSEKEKSWIVKLKPFYNRDEKGGYPSFSGCKGKPKSEEGRKNIAEANRRKAKDPEYLKHMADAHRGLKHPLRVPRPRFKWLFPDGTFREMTVQNATKCYIKKGIEIIKVE